MLNGIQTTPVWDSLPEDTLEDLSISLREIFSPYHSGSDLNEATTEQEIILKVLALLDWSDLALPQTAAGGRREDVPDFLLCPDLKAKQSALRERRDRRYRHGIAILESKRWMRSLDRGYVTDRLDPSTPSNQCAICPRRKSCPIAQFAGVS